MALDTAQKRSTALLDDQPLLPDATIDQPDRGYLVSQFSASAERAEWRLYITKRDGTPVHTFYNTDAIGAGASIAAFEGRDIANDIGLARLTMPGEHTDNDFLAEDWLAHWYLRDTYVTSFIIRVPDVTIIDPQQGARLAVYQLSHLLGVAEEGIVEPPGGAGSQPAGQDRIFDSSDPAYNDSGWSATNVLMSVADASPIYPAVTPYGGNIPNPAGVQLVGPVGYTIFDNAPSGRMYYRWQIIPSVTGWHRLWAVSDNACEGRVDGKTIVPWQVGWVSARPGDVLLTAGETHTIWFVVENGGTPGSEGPCTLAWSLWSLNAGGEPDVEVAVSDGSGKMLTFPAAPPGFNDGEILLTTLAEEQAYGALVDVVPSFNASVDSGGTPWPAGVAMSTKSRQPLEQFWVREMTESRIDIDAHWGGGAIVLDAWVKGTHRHEPGDSMFRIASTMTALEIPGARRLMSSACVQWNDAGNVALTDETASPPSGKPVKRRPLDLGAARDLAQVDRDSASQLDQFNRKREKPTIRFAYNVDRNDDELPPLAFWKWTHTTVQPGTTRWMALGADVTLIAVSWVMNRSGLFDVVPETGDLILPAESTASTTLRKMAPPMLNGQSRVATPV